MREVILSYPGDEALADALASARDAARGALHVRAFPDGESHVRVDAEVLDRVVTLVCSLHRPDVRMVPLALAASTARDLGASGIYLVAPYLPYMRQDARFVPGEGVSSRYVARWLDGLVDGVVTVDPHLHRVASLGELFHKPTQAVSAAGAIARWVRGLSREVVIVGPDAESAQWAQALARELDVPWLVMEKVRRGDRDVCVQAQGLERASGRLPILIDDIISTGRTMAQAAAALVEAGCERPVAVGVHAVFADDAVALLHQAGCAQVVTCDTIPHATNAIALSETIALAYDAFMRSR